MNQQEAKNLIRDTFQNPFDEQRFRLFAKNLFNDLDESKAFSYQGQYIPDAYKDHVRQYKRLGKYTDPEGAALDVLVVNLKREAALDRARTMQRNFIAWYLKHRGEKDAAIVAYHTDGLDDWRFSYVRMDYQAEQDESGKVRVKTDLTPARRYSFLVGKNEPNHTAQQQLLPIVQDDRNNPTLAELEKAFNIETVTREFFERYKNLFLKVKEELDELVEKDRRIREDFTAKGINTADFAKKLLGQIVFLYFLQKKGWLGVEKDSAGTFKGWGSGPKDFMQRLYRKEIVPYGNFFNDLLEPLFYEALAIDRGEESYYSPFKCKIPFLNGGLFEPINGYNWQETDIHIRNETFGEVFDTFDLYNFTVREDEPLEKEVAVDPEMLGKVFENLLEVKDRKSKGAYYTPREIVHYMCQQSLINYLGSALNGSIGYERLDTPQTELFAPQELAKSKSQMELMAKAGPDPVPREEIEVFIRQGDFGIENDIAKEQGTKSYSWKLPESIRTDAKRIDEALADIKICDPAIGSGAFPVGMLHEIVRARETLTVYLGDQAERTAYNFKRHAIQQSIYGVDIDCGAVDIAKLRLWLSLVVDEDDFQTIKPLPNLDYKIVCGNSLLQVERNVLNHHLFAELETLKQRFFDEINPRQKKEEKARIGQLIRLLTNNDEHFDFEIYFSEVYHKKRGFDVVIANPPYGVSQPKELKKYFDTYSHRGESYILFVEKGLEILRDGGHLSYIVPDTYLNLSFAAPLRNHLLKISKIKEIVVLPARVFESATVDTTLLSAEKSFINSNFHETDVKVKTFTKQNKVFDIDSPTQETFVSTTVWHEQGTFNVCIDCAESELIARLDKQFRTVGELTEMFYGIKAYQVGKGKPPQTEEIRSTKPFTSSRREHEKFLPFFDGKHIGRYQLNWKEDNWLHYGPWLAEPRNPDKFKGEKILIRKIVAETLIATYVPDTSYSNTLLYVLKLKPDIPLSYLYQLGILNSRFIGWYFRKKFQIAAEDTFPQIMISDIQQFPIPEVSSDQQAPIIERVQKILANPASPDVPRYEAEIDRLVYELYGLTEEEIELVKGKS
ncbi:MAG: N-6 DNA methylase [Geobacteraceae bacterium]|nr:N-6 DNA methylase [Geobacteraceae bacterium]